METKKRMMKKRLNKTRNKEEEKKYINKIRQINSSIYLYFYILNKIIKKINTKTLLYIYI